MIFLGIVTHYVQESLESAWGVSKKIGVVGNTHNRDGKRSDLEAKLGVFERLETGVDVDLEVTTGSDVALPVPLELFDLPAELIVQLNVAVCVFICVFTISQDITSLSIGIQLSDLYIPLNRGERGLPVQGHSKAGQFSVHRPPLTFTPLYGSKKVGDSSGEAKLVRTLFRTED